MRRVELGLEVAQRRVAIGVAARHLRVLGLELIDLQPQLLDDRAVDHHRQRFVVARAHRLDVGLGAGALGLGIGQRAIERQHAILRKLVLQAIGGAKGQNAHLVAVGVECGLRLLDALADRRNLVLQKRPGGLVVVVILAVLDMVEQLAHVGDAR